MLLQPCFYLPDRAFPKECESDSQFFVIYISIIFKYLKFFTLKVLGVPLLEWGCRGEPHAVAARQEATGMSEIEDKVGKKQANQAAKRRPASGVRLSPARLRKMITKLMTSLESDTQSGKASVSELLKLMQLYKELTADQVKEVEVRWVDRLHPDEEQGR